MTTTQTDAIKLAIEALERNKRGLENIELFGKSNVKFSGLTEMIEKTGAALAALQAREGAAVANSAILARGRFHALKGEDGEPDDWEWFEEGTNCEHGCIDAVIVRADAIAAPQAAQPSEPAHPEQGELTGCACRWDADDNRVATCVRHQGWLDVVHEWAERAKSAETTLQSAQPEQGERPASKAELLKNLTQWLDGLGLEIHTYSLRGIALHGFEKGWDAALQSAQPVALPLTVDVCFIDGDDPFICTVHGKITVDALSEIEADIHENPDFGKGDGVYSYNVTRFNGQYGFEGRCELPPGWELDEIGYEPIEAAHGIGGGR